MVNKENIDKLKANFSHLPLDTTQAKLPQITPFIAKLIKFKSWHPKKVFSQG